MSYNKKKIEETISFNPFKKLNSEWAVVTAGKKDAFNAMTISWGGFGVLWGKNICFCVVRPQRYTRKFMDSENFFTISFFPKRYKKALEILGTLSGKDTDKIKKSALTPVFSDSEIPYFKEANLIFFCRKIYIHDLKEKNFIDKKICLENYSKKDFHRFYVGEIINCIKKR